MKKNYLSNLSSCPAAKKVKMDLRYAQSSGGKTYLHWIRVKKNFEKLLRTISWKEVSMPKECLLGMWRVYGLAKWWSYCTKTPNGVYYLPTSPQWRCIKIGIHKSKLQSGFSLWQRTKGKLILNWPPWIQKKQKSKEDIKLISDLIARREVCFQGVNSKGLAYDKKSSNILTHTDCLNSKKKSRSPRKISNWFLI
jgi:hypothetical protein